MPALGELYTVYNNKDYMNYALSLVGKKDIPTEWHWSSSEYAASIVWILYFINGAVDDDYKDRYYYVRPVLAF